MAGLTPRLCLKRPSISAGVCRAAAAPRQQLIITLAASVTAKSPCLALPEHE